MSFLQCLMRAVVAVCVVSLAGAGCGRLPATVSGKVTLDGKAVGSGAVVFYPAAGGAAVHGQIGEDGRFVLQTGKAEGLQAGEYVATVMSRRGQPTLDMTPAQIDALDVTPTKYRKRITTDLRYTVHSGRNEIDIALKSR